ncbi:hypothetical protein [Mycobacterium leprae]|uniref:hypothetical protein n=1 Tax=Mycobacterium leprae TaxID=1769 RepID=UPI0002F435E3|nr:hypothetical protein [Mycobacterium leprae]
MLRPFVMGPVGIVNRRVGLAFPPAQLRGSSVLLAPDPSAVAGQQTDADGAASAR